MNTFKKLGLSDEVLKVLSELGFEKPSEIQSKAIPTLLKDNRNFIGLAQTGTGKTAAFGLPLIERINTRIPTIQALILSPTRELGQQIAQQLEIFSKFKKGVKTLPVYGGASIVQQMKSLKKNPPQIVIATPGRLIDLVKRKALFLDEIEYVVLDEADEMLNMGFKEELDKILSYTPSDKLTWLFSATMPKEIQQIVNNYMDNPLEVSINSTEKVNTNIDHKYAIVKQADKEEALSRFLDIDPTMRGVVFCRTKRDTQELAEFLQKKGYRVDALHGDLSQAQRDQVMNRFKDSTIQVLVATDVAARGIDVNDLTHVFHFSMPDDDSFYTHRSGRTARAGKKGTSIAFINGRENYKIRRIEKALGITFSRAEIPLQENIIEQRVEGWCMDVLDRNAKGLMGKPAFETANTIFGNLSKEELVAKILSYELDKLGLENTRDLNQNFSQGNSKSKPGDRRNHGNFSKKKGRNKNSKRGKKRFERSWQKS